MCFDSLQLLCETFLFLRSTERARINVHRQKVKLTLEQATKAQVCGVDVQLYSLTSALKGVGSQRHAPAALTPPGKTKYPLYTRLGEPHDQSGLERGEKKLHRFSSKLPVMLVIVDETASEYNYNIKQHPVSLSFQFTVQRAAAGRMSG